MGYTTWFNEHACKHKKIVDRLLARGFNTEQIIAYFDFDNMVLHENDFCPLYANNTKCHDMDSLNCYLCACPYFRFNDKGIKKVDTATQFSLCDITSKRATEARYGESIHLDCSNCTIPHTSTFVHKHFSLDYKEIMRECSV